MHVVKLSKASITELIYLISNRRNYLLVNYPSDPRLKSLDELIVTLATALKKAS